MICNEIITKDKMTKYLTSILINKNNLYLFMEFFNNLKDINKHEKILFLLYNEYISINDILSQIGTANDLSGINNIINEHTNKFITPYAFIKENFFRDYVTTLTFEHYKNIKNIIAQMDIVYETLTEPEKSFLIDRYEIDGGNFYKLIRPQMNESVIELSEVEKSTELLSKVSSDLSSNESFHSISDGKSVEFIVSELLKSVLKKIDLGTIH